MKNKEKKLFPLFVDFTGKKAVVVEAGEIATRRVKTPASFSGRNSGHCPKGFRGNFGTGRAGRSDISEKVL